MRIYMKERNCYTYIIGWVKLNKWYYGSKYGKDANPELFWVDYFTSSKEVKKFRSENGEPDFIKVRKVFGNNPEKCLLYEYRFLKRVNAADSEIFLNKSNGGKNFQTVGKKIGRDSVTGERLGMISVNDPRWESGEIIPWQKGIKQNPKNTLKNTAVAKISGTDSSIGRVSLFDPRWSTGEIVSIMVDNPNATKFDGTKIPAKCARSNQKLGLIDVNDPRWESGEICSILKGVKRDSIKSMINAKDPITGESIGKFHKTDPRWESGEIINLITGVKRLDKKSTQPALDINLKSVGCIPLSDLRWGRNQLLGITAKYFVIIQNGENKKIIPFSKIKLFSDWDIVFMSILCKERSKVFS